MKKIGILLLVGLLVLFAAGCTAQNTNVTADETKAPTTAPDEPIDGGWGEAQSIAVTDEVQAMFDKLNETMTGAYYVPVAYLSSQVVAGTNHKLLCKMIPSTPNIDALGTYVIVTVYEDPEGNVEITQVFYSNVAAPQPHNPDNPVAGGWAEPESYELTEEAKEALKKAGADATCEPIALLGTQIVAGTNYLLLCKSNEDYTILTVYADLQGGAEVTAADRFVSEGSESANRSEDSASSTDPQDV